MSTGLCFEQFRGWRLAGVVGQDSEVPESPAATVEPQWVAARLGDAGVRIVELDVSRAAYDEGHIPGAVFWSAYSDLRDGDYLPIATRELEALLSRSGIAPETTTVFYGYAAALGFWLMTAHGHRNVRMLDGSRERWAQSGRAWSTEIGAISATAYSLSAPREDIYSTRVDVSAAIEDPAVVLLDVRSQAEFDGERFWPSGATADAGRAGRLPGAIGVPITLLRGADEAFRPVQEMREALEDAGVTPQQRIIVYCTIGNRASQAWLAMTEMLGYPHVSVYYGSWVEWGKTDDARIEA
jgi:thiosulfate/3-mercaptopyruvate sulfurtransferase